MQETKGKVCGMNEEKNKSIVNFIKKLPVKLDSNKKISLYEILKLKCPKTIKSINRHLEGKKKKLFPKNENKNKWYTVITNYLINSKILYIEQDKNGTKHFVEDEWEKYFIYPVSGIYSLDNLQNHLILYRQTAIQFLIKAGLLDEEEKELIHENNKKENIFSKHEKLIKTVMYVVFFITIINYIFMISKYGIKEITPFLSNTCLFTLSALIISTEKK